MRLTAGIDLNRTDNPAKNATMWRLVADFSWGMTYRFKLPHNITLAGGGSTSLDLGCVYNARNGNNPVAVEAGLDSQPHRLRIVECQDRTPARDIALPAHNTLDGSILLARLR